MPIDCSTGDSTSPDTPHSPDTPCPYTDFGLNTYDRNLPISFLRFFNQPIEQIPGYDAGAFQILTHGCEGVGLHWHTPVCVEIVNHICNDEDNNTLGITYKFIYVIAENNTVVSDSVVPCP